MEIETRGYPGFRLLGRILGYFCNFREHLVQGRIKAGADGTAAPGPQPKIGPPQI